MVTIPTPDRWQLECPEGHQQVMEFYPQTKNAFCTECDCAYSFSSVVREGNDVNPEDWC